LLIIRSCFFKLPKPTMSDQPFWKNLTPEQMSREQWESLCDHCGKCCLHKIEDIDTGRVFYTSVSCRYLDLKNCDCRDYANRAANVPDCVTLTAQNISEAAEWLPSTCAYKLVVKGKDLPDWHPLTTGDADSTRRTGNSVSGRVICESKADDPEGYYIDWIRP
jgi:uncharacterized cysteine cluster protein YcgN (CxxCxxCC family)